MEFPFQKINDTQNCQFHHTNISISSSSIIRRYITKSPKLPASIELKELVAMIKPNYPV